MLLSRISIHAFICQFNISKEQIAVDNLLHELIATLLRLNVYLNDHRVISEGF